MLRLLETHNFRMLRSNSVALRPFHVLVGQNATGKSTLLSAVQFIADLLRGGVPHAVEALDATFHDLCFRSGEPIQLAAELELPAEEPTPRRVRYEIEVGIEGGAGLRVLRENLFILPDVGREVPLQMSFFDHGVTVVHGDTPRTWRKVVSKTREGRDYFRDERTSWNNMFRFGLEKAALGSLPEDPERFPLSIAARNALRDGVKTLALDAREMRLPSPPGSPVRIAPDGSNLPHAVRALKERDPVLFEGWVKHVAMAVEGLAEIDVWEREEDRHLVLRARFAGAHAEPVPSWLLSDGTLRLMALTLLSYTAREDELDIYLVEEPENGLHPLAIQVAYESLSQPLASTQYLCATHSPIFLAHVVLEEALVFRRGEGGNAIVRRGPEIPELRDWHGRTNLADLFVTGVLA